MSFCFPCFGGTSATQDSEREPLLPKHRTGQLEDEQQTHGGSPSVVDKFLDVLAALNAGKLPTQTQLARFLQIILHSELLRDDGGAPVSGHGPMSKEGRRVLGDIKGLVQAVLKFGLEKNADDIVQRLYLQVMQIDVEKGITAVGHAAHRAAGESTEGAENVEDFSSIADQVAFDAATFLHALRTLFEVCFKSPSFRFLLADFFSIVKDVVALAAADVEHAARQVQQAAEEVQHQAQSKDDIIDRVAGASAGDMKESGKEAIDKITDTTKKATHELKDDLAGLGDEASDKTKEQILQRVQEVLSRVQKDPASRSALRAILILAGKYAEQVASASEYSEAFVSDLVDQAQENANGAPNYPPQPYATPTPKPYFLDAGSDALLVNMKDVLQRCAQGHPLDSLLTAFGRAVRDIDTVPLVLNEEVERIVSENEEPDSPLISIPEPLVALQPGQHVPIPEPAAPRKGKGKRNKKARMRQKKAAERAAKMSPAVSESQITASVSGQSTPPGDDDGELHIHESAKGRKNPLRPYFAAFGVYMDRALNQPDWAASAEGTKTLETLFDEGVELLNVVGGGLIEAGQDAATTQPDEAPSAPKHESEGDKARREFKADMKSLIDEVDAYINALQQDKTTMGVLNAISGLGEDFAGLFAEGVRAGSRSVPSVGSALAGLRGWTTWVGWAVPRVLRMLPAEAVPVPSVEVKTGNIEAALHALFVRGVAKGGDTGIRASLVPDEVVLTEWTEVHIDMVPHVGGGEEEAAGEQGVQTTSRLRVHVDGVRGKVEDVGYYFKYTGALAGYEDEGLLSLDVGSETPHTGLGADIELELEHDNDKTDSSPSSPDGVPGIVVRSASGNVLTSAPPHPTPPAPLFRVLDVRVALKSLRFRLSRSRHWLLNTVLQPLAGPLVARLATQVLEDRVRAALEVLADGLAIVVRDAEDRSARRFAARNSDKDVETEDADDGAARLGDWWRALLAHGPALFGRSTTPATGEHTELSELHRTSTTATTRGLIHTDTTTTVAQPHGTPAMVYNTLTREIEPVDLRVEHIGGDPEVVREEETVVAVGAGAQLFPGKGGPYGATGKSDGRGVGDVVRDMGTAAAETLRAGVARVSDIEEDYRHKFRKEERDADTWKSDAFDF